MYSKNSINKAISEKSKLANHMTPSARMVPTGNVSSNFYIVTATVGWSESAVAGTKTLSPVKLFPGARKALSPRWRTHPIPRYVFSTATFIPVFQDSFRYATKCRWSSVLTKRPRVSSPNLKNRQRRVIRPPGDESELFSARHADIWKKTSSPTGTIVSNCPVRIPTRLFPK